MAVLLLSVIGCILIVYGFLIQRIRSGTFFFMVWYLLGAVCLAISMLVKFHLWERIPWWIRIAFHVVILIWILSVCICEAFIVRGFSARYDDNPDYLIVLGAQVRKEGPSKVLAYRLDTTVDYMMHNKKALCIVTGGRGYNEPVTEAAAMKKYLTDKGIPGSRIIMEEKALNTFQNIQYSKALLPVSDECTVGIVTNNFHIFRATALAKKQGLNAYGIPAPSDPFYLLNNLFREYFGVMKDFLTGNI